MSHVAALAGEVSARTLPEPDDHALVAAIRLGDDRAFEQLYERYHRRVASYVRGMVKDHARAEDITQEVFLSALRRLRSSQQPITLKPWVYEIARNACIDQYRRSRRAPEIPYQGDYAQVERLVALSPSPDAALATKQQLDDLRHAFSFLPDTQHRILVMRELEGLSYREIGRRLNLTRPAVESALFRARRRLLDEYEQLASGARCARVQRAIAATLEGSAGARDRWRIASHIRHCSSCRRQARLTGVYTSVADALPPARVAGILPLPLMLRRLFSSRIATRVTSLPTSSTETLAQWTRTISFAGEPLSGWVAAGVTAAAIALTLGPGGGGASPHRTLGPVRDTSAVTATANVVAAQRDPTAGLYPPHHGWPLAAPVAPLRDHGSRRAPAVQTPGPGPGSGGGGSSPDAPKDATAPGGLPAGAQAPSLPTPPDPTSPVIQRPGLLSGVSQTVSNAVGQANQQAAGSSGGAASSQPPIQIPDPGSAGSGPSAPTAPQPLARATGAVAAGVAAGPAAPPASH